MSDSNDSHPEKPSKSQLKRDMIDLQKIGETLVNLSDHELAKIPLPESLFEAIKFAQSLKSHESIRRQLQYIGKLMREVDQEQIKTALKNLKMNAEANTRQFHQIEQWREQLITVGDDALKQFIETYPNTDTQHLRQLIRNAKHDRSNNKNTGSEKKLFQYIREIMQSL